ncbi:Rhodanese-like protein [Biscogniauxia sp. FL1348]|nr:Rhodanese-like protein [Biscogniauxia sp. FL1348]
MSLITVSSIERITASRLAEMLLAKPTPDPNIAVVDVRDDDFIGGHIKSCLHFPTRSLDATMPTLMRKLADKHTVVFHCALSQQRGPAAALRYLRQKEATSIPSSSSSSAGGGGSEKENGDSKRQGQKQKVYVLDRGFVGWQEEYGLDERLTEGYRKELWEEGY